LSPACFTTLALFLLGSMALIGQSSTAEASDSVPRPFLTMRAVVQYNGVPNTVQTLLYGGQGMVVTDLGAGVVTMLGFPAGTWLNPKTSKPCYFIPIVSADTNSYPVGIAQLTENADGSGSFIVENPNITECGAPVAGGSQYCSDAWWEIHGREVSSPMAGRAGQVALAAKRAERVEREETVSKPGALNQRCGEEISRWERKHSEVDLDAERQRYTREILPRLQTTKLSLGQIVAATGWTKGYARLVRANKKTPHPKHYATLVALLDANKITLPETRR
jgi:hypothetical protein